MKMLKLTSPIPKAYASYSYCTSDAITVEQNFKIAYYVPLSFPCIKRCLRIILLLNSKIYLSRPFTTKSAIGTSTSLSSC